LTVIKWLDIFTKPEYFQIITDSLKYCRQYKGLLIQAYVIMTNHLHLMVSARESVARDYKSLATDYKSLATVGDKTLEGICNPEQSFQNIPILSAIIRDFKKYTAKKIYQQLKKDNRHYLSRILRIYKSDKNKDFQLWQHDNHAITIESEKFFDQKINYIHNNPVEKQYVEKPEDWLYSSARNYFLDDNSIMEIDVLE